MVGRELSELYPRSGAQPGTVQPGAVALEVVGLTRAGAFREVSFQVRRGEIVGLAGLVGAGRSEVARAIFGIDAYESGEVRLGGKRIPRSSVGAAMGAGLALVPEDRRQQRLLMNLSIERNATLCILQRLSRLGLMNRVLERETARSWTEKLRLKGHILTGDHRDISFKGRFSLRHFVSDRTRTRGL